MESYLLVLSNFCLCILRSGKKCIKYSKQLSQLKCMALEGLKAQRGTGNQSRWWCISSSTRQDGAKFWGRLAGSCFSHCEPVQYSIQRAIFLLPLDKRVGGMGVVGLTLSDIHSHIYMPCIPGYLNYYNMFLFFTVGRLLKMEQLASTVWSAFLTILINPLLSPEILQL